MSYSTVLGLTPGQAPVGLLELRNAHGWGPSIWGRMLRARGVTDSWIFADSALDELWQGIETQEPWEQIANVLTFDTGVIPAPVFAEAADLLDEFDRRLPAPEGHVNHVPAVAAFLRSGLTVPFVGIWGTSVTDNPFATWVEECDGPGPGIPPSEWYVLRRHRDIASRLLSEGDLSEKGQVTP